MEKEIVKILSELAVKVSEYFHLDSLDALAAVSQSRLANELSSVGNVRNLTMDELCKELYNEISMGE